MCFVAGTEVKTEEGRKAIEEIEAGDRVYARDTETGEEGYKEVVRVFRKETKELIHLWIGNTKIDTTPNHPFWVEGYGFREAGELQGGDMVLTADGEVVRVACVEMRALPYNADLSQYRQFEVVKSFEVKASTIAPAFGEIGLGTQYQFSISAKVLLRRGIIKQIGGNH